MTGSTIEELQRENAELRERLERLRDLLDTVVDRIMPNVMVSGIAPRMINLTSPKEIGPHLREMALYCVRVARECTDAQFIRELEGTSIVLADRASSLETILSATGRRN